MATVPFEQTLTALRSEARAQKRWFLLGLLLLGGLWLAIAWRVPLPTQLSSSEGGIVSAGASVSVLSPSDEPLTVVAVSLGQPVAAGDLLLQFDVQDLQLNLASKMQQRAQQVTQIDSVALQQSTLAAELVDEQRGAAQEIQRLQSKRQQSLSKIDFARKAEQLYSQLRSERRIDRLKYEEAAATLTQEELELAAVSSELAQANADRELAASRVASQQAELQERHARLVQQGTDLQREVDQLRREIDQSRVLAPSAAVVGDLAQIGPGAVLPKDQWAMTLIPQRPPEFRAKFPERLAGGQVRPGQLAQIELFAFPWVEYGTVPAAVVRVGRVATAGLVEVVFAFDLGPEAERAAGVPQLQQRIQQGLQGRVRVEVGTMTLAQRFLQLLSHTPPEHGASNNSTNPNNEVGALGPR